MVHILRRLDIAKFLSPTTVNRIVFHKVHNIFQQIYGKTAANNRLFLACAFYAIFIPSDANRGVELDSENIGNTSPARRYSTSTQPLGAASTDYLQISGASCGGCCALSAAFDKPACSPQGTFYPSLSVSTETTKAPIRMTQPTPKPLGNCTPNRCYCCELNYKLYL